MRFLFIVLCLVICLGGVVSSRPMAKKYLVVIHDGKGDTEVLRTDYIADIDSIMTAHGLPAIADSLLDLSPFFEIRVDRFKIYAERKEYVNK